METKVNDLENSLNTNIKNLQAHTGYFKQLKNLLQTSELEQLQKVEQALSQLNEKIDNEESIKNRVLPLFDEILLSSLQNKDQKTIAILSQYLAQTLQHASTHDTQALAKSLQSILSSTISKEIEKNQDKMVDALYPILGGMVSKYVSQAIKKLVESINKQIEEGLSVKRFKRKAKSLTTGVSEAQLLLEEASDAHILAMFVLQKESALLIAQAQLEESTIGDPHMVASMASAIKDFINDWVSSTKDQKEVQILSYGSVTLYIESAGSVYLIAFLDTEPDHQIREEMNTFFASLVRQYSPFFQAFEGDDSAGEIVEIAHKMQSYLDNQKSLDSIKKVHKPTMKYIALGIGAVMVLFLGFKAYQSYQLYTIEKSVKEQTGYSINLQYGDHGIVLYGDVKNFEDEQKIRSIIKSMSDLSIKNNLRMKLPDIYAILEKDKRQTNQKIHNQITQLNDKMDAIEADLINKLYLEESIIIQTQALLSNEKAIVVREDGSLDFSDLKLFDPGNVTISSSDQQRIKRVTKLYLELLLTNPTIRPYVKQIIIEGHTDSIGTIETNKRISRKRAQMVKEYILSLNLPKSYHLDKLLVAKGVGSSELIYLNGKEDKEASRRIKIKLLLDKQLLFKNMKKSVQ